MYGEPPQVQDGSIVDDAPELLAQWADTPLGGGGGCATDHPQQIWTRYSVPGIRMPDAGLLTHNESPARPSKCPSRDACGGGMSLQLRMHSQDRTGRCGNSNAWGWLFKGDTDETVFSGSVSPPERRSAAATSGSCTVGTSPTKTSRPGLVSGQSRGSCLVLACALRPTQEAAAKDPCRFESIDSPSGQLWGNELTDHFSQRSLQLEKHHHPLFARGRTFRLLLRGYVGRT